MTLVHHAALVVAVAALAAAGVRAARALQARGLELAISAAAIACTAAGIEALGLGLVGWGGSPTALTVAAVLTWAVAAARWPGSALSDVGSEIAAWWARRGQAERIALGLIAGALGAWVAWVVKHPSLGIDPVTYHMPESIIWVQNGHPGDVQTLQYEFPQGYYPVTNELLVGWLTGIAHTEMPGLLWSAALAVLGGAAGFLFLRRIGAGVAASALAALAALLIPTAAEQMIGPHTDLPALAWLWSAAALVAAADRRPTLLVPALLAAALCVGTKTTPAPLLALIFVWAAWRHRSRLKELAPLLSGALVAGVAVGGVWYVRNLVVHGSPLWPFVSTSFGDPLPPYLHKLDVSFLDRPKVTLDRNAHAYLKIVAGGWLLLALGLLAPLLHRRRAVLAAFGLTVVAGVSWMKAPFTGAPHDRILDTSATTIRYLLPTISAAAAAGVLAGEAGPRRRMLVLAALAGAVVWSLVAGQHLDFAGLPGLGTLAVGAAGGVAVAWALGRVRLPSYVPAVPAAVVVLAALAGGLTVANHGFAHRQGGAVWLASSGVVTWAAEQPAWRSGSWPIAFAPQMVATLSGDRLQHPISLIGQHESCAAVAQRARRGWVVIGYLRFPTHRARFSAGPCLRSPRPGVRVVYSDSSFTVFGPATA